MPDSLSNLQRRLRDLLEQTCRKASLPGVGLVVLTEGREIGVFAGCASLGSRKELSAGCAFHLGCVVKPLVAGVAAELASRGHLNFDAVLERYLPELAGTQQGRCIRVRDLLCHTSGYSDCDTLQGNADSSPDSDACIRGFLESRQLFIPGTVFSYQHFPFILLGQIVNRITGCRIEELVDTLVLARSGVSPRLTRVAREAEDDVVGHVWQPSRKMYEPLATQGRPGSIWDAALSHATITLGDTARVFRALCCDERMLQRRRVDIPPFLGLAYGQQLPTWYGVGLEGFRDGLLGFNSRMEGQVMVLRCDPTRDLVVVLAVNAPVLLLRFKLLEAVLEIIRGPLVKPEPVRLMEEFATGELTGIYRSDPSFAVIVEGGDSSELTLSLQANDRREPIAWIPTSRGECSPQPARTRRPIAFFRDPHSREPCLMVGLRALRRE